MKYNDNGTYKDIYVKVFDTLPIGAIVEYSGATIPSGWTDIGNNQIQKTSQYMGGGASISNVYGTSQSDGYSQEYINDIGTTVNLFGNVGGSSVGTFDLYSHIVGTKINYNTWKFEIEGKMDISGATQQYNWGIMPSKISDLLNSAIGKQERFDETLSTLGTWEAYNPSTKLPYVDKYNYGTTFEFNINTYFMPARYYQTSGPIGGWALSDFINGSFMRATIYLREL